jgi:hypothetical protein
MAEGPPPVASVTLLFHPHERGGPLPPGDALGRAFLAHASSFGTGVLPESLRWRAADCASVTFKKVRDAERFVTRHLPRHPGAPHGTPLPRVAGIFITAQFMRPTAAVTIRNLEPRYFRGTESTLVPALVAVLGIDRSAIQRVTRLRAPRSVCVLFRDNAIATAAVRRLQKRKLHETDANQVYLDFDDITNDTKRGRDDEALGGVAKFRRRESSASADKSTETRRRRRRRSASSSGASSSGADRRRPRRSSASRSASSSPSVCCSRSGGDSGDLEKAVNHAVEARLQPLEALVHTQLEKMEGLLQRFVEVMDRGLKQLSQPPPLTLPSGSGAEIAMPVQVPEPPHALSVQPHALSVQPHALPEQPHALPGQPQAVPVQPHALPEQPPVQVHDDDASWTIAAVEAEKDSHHLAIRFSNEPGTLHLAVDASVVPTGTASCVTLISDGAEFPSARGRRWVRPKDGDADAKVALVSRAALVALLRPAHLVADLQRLGMLSENKTAAVALSDRIAAFIRDGLANGGSVAIMGPSSGPCVAVVLWVLKAMGVQLDGENAAATAIMSMRGGGGNALADALRKAGFVTSRTLVPPSVGQWIRNG